MKIVILSDIHGNLPALQAVSAHIDTWQPDRVIVAGDIVNRGPQSLACWQLLQDKVAGQEWQLCKGNHEDYVIGHGRADDVRAGAQFELSRVSFWTYQQLNGNVAALADLPDGCTFWGPDGGELRVRHASMHHNRDGIYPEADDMAVTRQIAPAPAVFATAHTHRPFSRQVNGTLVVNAGSVGTPADGDSRASYAQIVWQHGRWQAHIARVSYNREQTRQDYFQSHILAEAGSVAALIYYEWQIARYLFPEWLAHYWPAVLAGDVDMATAVNHYLQQFGLPVPICP